MILSDVLEFQRVKWFASGDNVAVILYSTTRQQSVIQLTCQTSDYHHKIAPREDPGGSGQALSALPEADLAKEKLIEKIIEGEAGIELKVRRLTFLIGMTLAFNDSADLGSFLEGFRDLKCLSWTHFDNICSEYTAENPRTEARPENGP